jgi:hypothetical protein
MSRSVTEYETKKYEKMWKFKDYRQHSPGTDVQEAAYNLMGLNKGDSIIDYGCGEGHTVRYFRDRGLFSRGIDLVSLFPAAIIASLWEIPEDITGADYAFSADVMEHIPTDLVYPSLENIARLTAKEAYFQIAIGEDSHGALIGKKLHLTVKPVGWWRVELLKHFSQVSIGGDCHYRFTAHCKK